jgi:catechol 2,3-dioxygenase-like lactoylglutathione lyase family enzyme
MELNGTVTLLEVFNMQKSIDFYCNTLGFKVVQSAGVENYIGWIWLKNANVELMLNSMYELGEEPDTPDQNRMANHADTTLFIGCKDLDSAYEYLKLKGVSVNLPVVTHYGMKQLAFADPDNYGICLQWPIE